MSSFIKKMFALFGSKDCIVGVSIAYTIMNKLTTLQLVSERLNINIQTSECYIFHHKTPKTIFSNIKK